MEKKPKKNPKKTQKKTQKQGGDRGGRFQAGGTPGPGRPPGVQNRATAARAEIAARLEIQRELYEAYSRIMSLPRDQFMAEYALIRSGKKSVTIRQLCVWQAVYSVGFDGEFKSHLWAELERKVSALRDQLNEISFESANAIAAGGSIARADLHRIILGNPAIDPADAAKIVLSDLAEIDRQKNRDAIPATLFYSLVNGLIEAGREAMAGDPEKFKTFHTLVKAQLRILEEKLMAQVIDDGQQ